MLSRFDSGTQIAFTTFPNHILIIINQEKLLSLILISKYFLKVLEKKKKSFQTHCALSTCFSNIIISAASNSTSTEARWRRSWIGTVVSLCIQTSSWLAWSLLYLSARVLVPVCFGNLAGSSQTSLGLISTSQEQREKKACGPAATQTRADWGRLTVFSQQTNTNSSLNTCMQPNLNLAAQNGALKKQNKKNFIWKEASAFSSVCVC